MHAFADWAAARASLDGLPDGRGLNIAYEAVDRHVVHGHGDDVALRFLTRDGTTVDMTYTQLAEQTNRFANVLIELGVQPGEAVFVLSGRTPELYVAVLGALKHRCVVTPLFAAFGPQPIAERMALGHAAVLVTTGALYERKVKPIRDTLPALRHVLIGGDRVVPTPPQVIDLHALMASSSPSYEIEATDPETPALVHFTSGTTGRPKGALHVHEAVVAHHATGRNAFDLGRGDVFWCTADPGWVTGTSYGIIAPLTHGATVVVDERELDAERWYSILADQHVNVWYTAPTAIRMLMRAGTDVPSMRRARPDLRLAASVGEPLGPDAVRWGIEALGIEIHDTWWQTETGGIMIASPLGEPVRPGSMGRPLPGVDAVVLRCDDDGVLLRDPAGNAIEVRDASEAGMLALRRGWPSMFRTYLANPDRYATSFEGDWYLTGDLVRRDDDGWFWFVSRSDDVIKTAGHLIGPSEVERVLLMHPAVADAGVYGVPDPVAGAVVHAVVVLQPGVEGDGPDTEGAVRRDLVAHARRHLGAAVAPREIFFADDVPKTRSGKIMRRLLRARELGLPEGDLSTLQSAPELHSALELTTAATEARS
jgi:acetyl-CoA synthetase